MRNLSIFGDDETTPIVTYRSEELDKLIVVVGPGHSTAKLKVINGGRSIIIFLDLTLKTGMDSPRRLYYLITLASKRKDGISVVTTSNGPSVNVVSDPVMVIHSPVRGKGWVAFNGLFNTDHRKTLIAIYGKERIGQHLVIDWQQLGPDGWAYHDGAKQNTNYYGFGTKVLSVAGGTVSALKDSLPENFGNNGQSSRAVTLETIAGNYLILDLGRGHFVMYAHLQPGNQKVKLGDKVKTGQVLALLGNTGNSDAPHLHFQVMDANSTLGAEGIPYELETYNQAGVVNDFDAIDTDKSWQPEKQAIPIVHKYGFLIDNAVVNFP